jgi:hypothetical protein
VIYPTKEIEILYRNFMFEVKWNLSFSRAILKSESCHSEGAFAATEESPTR